MLEVLHISAECYPAAKAGGLGDVVGALPKYLNQAGVQTGVVMPKYKLKWIVNQTYIDVGSGLVRLDKVQVPFYVQQVTSTDLGFPLFVVNIPGLFDRNGIYTDNDTQQSYPDDVERYLVFQQAVLHWLNGWHKKPLVLHCHDHHTGLIPFMVKHCPEFRSLAQIKTVFTIHNGVYHGAFRWSNAHLLPWFDAYAAPLLDWNNTINPLACAIKCCWKLTTVSPGYMQELMTDSNGLEGLISSEWRKAKGIINGIDNAVWNPMSDPMLPYNLSDSIEDYKKYNRSQILQRFNLQADLPIVTFIGRLVGEKGADILPQAIRNLLYSGQRMNFLLLGTGERHLMNMIQDLKHEFPGLVDCMLGYDETLSHLLYAGSDFLIMPSRIEPCGLNQLYALRYGTIPIVRKVGGLNDTVKDIDSPEGGVGIQFTNLNAEDCAYALYRANRIFENKQLMSDVRAYIMSIDHSWEVSVQAYIQVYN